MMAALKAVRSLQLREWCVGAGAVRSLVWDALHGKSSPSELADVDVAYFDTSEIGAARDEALRAALARQLPGVAWDVTNQAGVHRWFEAYFGHPVAPLASLEDGIASWPEFATAIGVSLEPNDSIRVIAPHGLDDLFGMIVRRNAARVSIETYRQRVAQKRWQARWPMVRVMEE